MSGLDLESIIWIVTGRCNLNCKHCYASPYRVEVELGKAEALRLAKELAEVGVKYINLTGGEPLLRKDIFELLEYCIDLGIDVSVFTNMTLVSREVAEKLSRLEIYTLTSLDGHNREVFELVRGHGSWERFLQGLSYARDAGVELHINISVNELNWMYIDKIISKAVELGGASISLIPSMPAGNALKNRVYVTSNHFRQAIEMTAEKAEELGMDVAVWCAPFIGLVTESKRIIYGNCRNWGVMDISPSGKALICDVLNIRVADVIKEGVLEAWRRLTTGKIGRMIHEPKIKSVCMNCPQLSKCLGGCYARAYITYGDLESPDPLCPRIRGI